MTINTKLHKFSHCFHVPCNQIQLINAIIDLQTEYIDGSIEFDYIKLLGIQQLNNAIENTKCNRYNE